MNTDQVRAVSMGAGFLIMIFFRHLAEPHWKALRNACLYHPQTDRSGVSYPAVRDCQTDAPNSSSQSGRDRRRRGHRIAFCWQRDHRKFVEHPCLQADAGCCLDAEQNPSLCHGAICRCNRMLATKSQVTIGRKRWLAMACMLGSSEKLEHR